MVYMVNVVYMWDMRVRNPPSNQGTERTGLLWLARSFNAV